MAEADAAEDAGYTDALAAGTPDEMAAMNAAVVRVADAALAMAEVATLASAVR